MPTDNFDETSEPIEPIPELAEETLPVEASSPTPGFSRRTFLKAAALGTAAAALFNTDPLGRLEAGPLSVSANDLSGNPCTANDFSVGTGVILNVKDLCTCTSTFTAQVKFPVTSTQNATRKCISLHLPSGTDIVLRNTLTEAIAGTGNSFFAGSGTGFMYAMFPNFPCDASQPVCFGVVNCAGTGCATVGWDTASGSTPFNATCTSADPSPPRGQCRHQQICIAAFGATLACNATAQTATTTCTPTCGGSTILTAGVLAPDAGPYTFTLTGPNSYSASASVTGTPVAGEPGQYQATHNFLVTTPSGTSTYSLSVCDSTLGGSGCCKTASTTLTSNPLGNPTVTHSNPDCSGQTTVTVTPSGGTGTISYSYTIDGGSAVAAVTASTFTHTFTPGSTHTVSVTLTDSLGCTAAGTTTITVLPAVTASVTATAPGCAGGATSITATASGGTAPYAYSFFDGATGIGATAQASNTLSTVLAPGPHTISVTVTDSNSCFSNSSPVTITVPSPVTATVTGSPPDCSTGMTSLSATAGGGTPPYKYSFFDGATGIGATAQDSSTLSVQLSSGPHTITVTVTDANSCSTTSAPVTITVPQPVTATLALSGNADCDGALTFTATAGGGTGSYVFQFKNNGVTVKTDPSTGTTTSTHSTFAYGPVIDVTPAVCHTISVTVTDSANCQSATSPSISVSQCVTTITCSTTP